MQRSWISGERKKGAGDGIAANIRVIEPLGDKKDVYLDTNSGTGFIANIDPYVQIKVGDTVTMYVDSEKLHVFEQGDTGRNITLSSD